MLLRNKKTGEIFDWREDIMPFGLGLPHPKSLAELNEEWGDYEPVEPLIKDEKIRKAVRAWAEANEMEFMDIIDDSTIKDCSSKHIEFLGLPFRELPKVSVYIDELCGEEKK